jgi:ring-1,2-phenylacetyl-CoA epoxidase subunit PaaE
MKFHKLAVAAVDRLCDDALAITFTIPPDLIADYDFRAGQHVTVDEQLRRSYSICSTPMELHRDGTLRIGLRVLPDGEFSAQADLLSPGDLVEVLTPLGRFTSDFASGRTRRYGAVVAGSGITPVLSHVATALALEPESTFAVIFGNRTARSVMFSDELADLKDRYADRLQLIHVLSREAHEIELFHGRLDADRIARLLPLVGPVDEWFLCGPLGMVEAAREALAPTGASVRTELFHAETAPPPPARERAESAGDVALTIKLDGRSTELRMGSDERVLDAALRERPELPFACRGGVCSTCRAKVVSGTVNMVTNWALEPDDVAAGYVLTCQSEPTSAALTVDYDA